MVNENYIPLLVKENVKFYLGNNGVIFEITVDDGYPIILTFGDISKLIRSANLNENEFRKFMESCKSK